MADILILAVILGYAGFVLYRRHKNRKNGGCGCGCSGCSASCGKRISEIKDDEKDLLP